MQTPHACIHLEKFMYPLALVSGAPHKAYIFRFNTPTNNTYPASGTHTCLILRGYPPLVPIHFWQKVRGLTPPLCSYIITNIGSTPPTPEPVGVGDFNDSVSVGQEEHTDLSENQAPHHLRSSIASENGENDRVPRGIPAVFSSFSLST